MSHKALLLIDDSPEDVQLILHALRGVLPAEHIAVSPSAEDALDYLAARGAHARHAAAGLPRLILLDLNLPRIPGVEVLRQIRTNRATRLVPVVVLSASANRQDVAAAMLAGANSYVRKPLDYAGLHDALRLLARYWLELNIEPSSCGAG